jgi:hypothetical protein
VQEHDQEGERHHPHAAPRPPRRAVLRDPRRGPPRQGHHRRLSVPLYGACDKSAPLQWLNSPTDLLDTTIRAAAQRHGFTFIDLRGPFKGHSACDEGAWINHLYTHDLYKSFHPNAAGYREVQR